MPAAKIEQVQSFLDNHKFMSTEHHAQQRLKLTPVERP